MKARHNLQVLLAGQVFSTVLACQQPSSLPTAWPLSTPVDRPLLLQGPHSCVDDVCVYSDPAFGNGLSVVTTAANADFLGDRLRLPLAGNIISPTPFYESYIIGKGIGLVANATIRRGERLMVHTPTLLVHWPTHAKEETQNDTEWLYKMALEKLPAPSRNVFSQQMHIGGSGVRANIETNCFRFFLDGGHDESTGHLGCFPSAARLNHDCEPNLHYTITDGIQSIVAVRDISPGEELSISYVDLMLPSTERKARLHDWGFECGCRLCKDLKKEKEADARLEEIARLKTMLDTGDAAISLETGHRLVALYREQPGLGLYIGQQAYTRAALICGLFADEECAVDYARKAVEALHLELGAVVAASSQDVLSMERLAASPKTHWAWGLLKDRDRSKDKERTV
ncbi:hypothetical protein SBRCBS47491_001870 [Sporothrix bragantina]|uniref:SET domain-containing protein n=1 Tax=Sporothrix bragantina TaxID=671064 RepID=A0ABP0B285_9PEZI